MSSFIFMRNLCLAVKRFKQENPGVLEALTEERRRREVIEDGGQDDPGPDRRDHRRDL